MSTTTPLRRPKLTLTRTLILSLFNVGANNITVPNAVIGMAIFYGGLVQLLAGMWEFACGNTFGATGE